MGFVIFGIVTPAEIIAKNVLPGVLIKLLPAPSGR